MTTEVMPGEQKSWTETPPANPPLRSAIARLVESQAWLDTLGRQFRTGFLSSLASQGNLTA